MLKAIMKCFIPSSEKLGNMAAAKFAEAVNTSGKVETIALYTGKIETIACYANIAIELLKDGQIDKVEEAKIAAMLKPVFQSALDLI